MSTNVNKNNPQIIIVSGEKADGSIYEMGEVKVTFTTAAGVDTASVELVAATGAVASSAVPVTLTFS